MSNTGKRVVLVVGPTATGKSELGVALAKRLSGEVISADSMQVYRSMDVGTAKLSREEMDGVPHHLMDVVNPDEPFTAAVWSQMATSLIDALHAKGQTPIVVGGTGLYIRAITDGLNFADQPGSDAIRQRWQLVLEQDGPHSLHEALTAIDPASAARLHPNDTRRVIRALELAELRERPMSNDYEWTVKGGRYRCLILGLYMPRDVLYARVNMRVDKMMQAGLKAEVEQLLDNGYGSELTSMQAIGYKEMVAAVKGRISEGEAVDDIKRATRRFVKRQLSWFMRDPRIVWLPKHIFDPLDNVETLVHILERMAEGFSLPEGE